MMPRSMSIEEYKSNIKELLLGSTFRDNDSSEMRAGVLKKVQYEGPPVRLFQYRSADHDVIECLKYGALYYKSPNRFNDPYDSLMRWDEEVIGRYFRDEKCRGVLNRHGIYNSETLAVSIRNRFRVSCFSEVPDSPLMWAHYAKNGTGFCAEYELYPTHGCVMCLQDGDPCEEGRIGKCRPASCGCVCKRSLLPVVYTAARPDATEAMKIEIEHAVAQEQGTEFDLSKYDWLEPYRTALIKSEDWSYEREWRLMLSDNKLRGDQECRYPSVNLVRIILGPRMNPKDEFEVAVAVEEYARSVRRDVELSKVYVDVQSRDYKFNIRHEYILKDAKVSDPSV